MQVSGGLVHHGARHLPFGALAEEAAKMTPPDPPVLRPRAAENPATAPAGSARLSPAGCPPRWMAGGMFAGDVRLPDMVYAAIRHAPRGRTWRWPGMMRRGQGHCRFPQLVEGPTGWPPSQQLVGGGAALAAIAPRFAVQHPLESAQIEAALDKALKRATRTAWPRAAMPMARWATSRNFPRYDLPCHAARWKPPAPRPACAMGGRDLGRLAGARTDPPPWPGAGHRAAHGGALSHGGGGSFDARLECAHVEEAAIAQRTGKPVLLTYSRWQEHVAGLHRPPMAAQVEARADQIGQRGGMAAAVAMPSRARIWRRMLMAPARPRRHSQTAAIRWRWRARAALCHSACGIDHAPRRMGLPTGGCAAMACAARLYHRKLHRRDRRPAGREPLSFRMAMLEGDPRLAACLQRVSALANWNGGMMPAAGLACHRMGAWRAGAASPPWPPRGAANRAWWWTASRPWPTSAASSTPTSPASRSRAGWSMASAWPWRQHGLAAGLAHGGGWAIWPAVAGIAPRSRLT
jgi:isoquinoline 1-oxidoreductase beta subunit